MQGVVVSSQITRAEFALALKASSRAARKDEQRRLLLIPLACLCAVLASTPVQEMSLSLYMAEESRGKEIKCCRNNPSQVRSAGESKLSFTFQKVNFLLFVYLPKLFVFTSEKGILLCRLHTDVRVLHLGCNGDSVC